jgi:hypothetical protein
MNSKKLSGMPSYYTASPADWVSFLTCWANQMSVTADLAKVDALHVSGLPTSYAHFVAATNGKGWQSPGEQQRFGLASALLLPVGSTGPLKRVSNANWKAWTQNKLTTSIPDAVYYNYTSTQDAIQFRDHHIDGLLVVGDLGGGAVLALNSAERTADGEWEAWLLSTQLPGALRFRSFAELVQVVYLMDVDPMRDVSQIRASDLNETCAGKIFGMYREQ